MIMVGPVAVLPQLQGQGYGQALVSASLGGIQPEAPLPQVMIGDEDYYGRFWGFTAEYTGDWTLPGPYDRARLLEEWGTRGRERGASAGLRGLRLQVALARGEVVEMAGDCYGDAVNVAARLLDHAGDNETLVTAEVMSGLGPAMQRRFRSLDWVHLRGRAEPVHVHVMGGLRGGDTQGAAMQFGAVAPTLEPEAVRLSWLDIHDVFDGERMPVVLGRSAQAHFRVEDSRVSRSHARLDWHGGVFQLTDLSYNGTYVRFGGGDEIVSLRRGSCTLHGTGAIGLGGTPTDPTSPVVRFEVLSAQGNIEVPDR